MPTLDARDNFSLLLKTQWKRIPTECHFFPKYAKTAVMLERPESWTRLQKLLFQFDEPTSRLYHVNIVSTLVLLILVAWWIQRRDGRGLGFTLKKWVARKRYWWNSSTKQDYQVYILNALFKTFLLIPLLECSFQVSQITIKSLVWFTDGELLDIKAKSGYIFAFTLGAFVWDDFLRFFNHWMMHKVPFLWHFHKLHHSARVLTPVTLYRAHPLESVIALLRNSVSLGVALGFFIFIFGSSFNLWTLLGINGFGFIFNLLGANLRHSHIPLSFGWGERVLISPIQHQVHHSKDPRHYDKNFGVSLAIWDWVGGTLVFSKEITGPIKVGLTERFRRSLWHHYKDPFVDLYQMVFRRKND